MTAQRRVESWFRSDFVVLVYYVLREKDYLYIQIRRTIHFVLFCEKFLPRHIGKFDLKKFLGMIAAEITKFENMI